MTIEYYTRAQYGQFRNFFIKIEERMAFQALTGRATLSETDIHTLKRWGLKFKQVPDPEAKV